MKIKSQIIFRKTLISELSSVQPGLAKRESIEQSSCFVFKDGKVMTFNEEIACSIKCCLKITGAIRSKLLIDILNKLKEDKIKIKQDDEQLLIRGSSNKLLSREGGIIMESEVLLPIEIVEIPEKWQGLPEGFLENGKLVALCASRDNSSFNLTCVHIHPEWFEACDNFRIIRVNVKMGVKESVLIRWEAVNHVVDLGMTEFSETESWMHFRNEAGLVLSCRRFIQEYPPLDELLEIDGDELSLPKGIIQAAENASIFSTEVSDQAFVTILLEKGSITIEGRGEFGWWREVSKIKYSGKSLRFLISSDLLIDIVKRYSKCYVTSERLIVEGDNFRYVSCLGLIDDKE